MTTEKARHVAELTRALKRVYWQGGTEYGSQWLASELYDHGIRVQTTDPATAPGDAHTALDALRDACHGCGCLQFEHAHRATLALRAVLDLADAAETELSEIGLPVPPITGADVGAAQIRAAITTALEGKA